MHRIRTSTRGPAGGRGAHSRRFGVRVEYGDLRSLACCVRAIRRTTLKGSRFDASRAQRRKPRRPSGSRGLNPTTSGVLRRRPGWATENLNDFCGVDWT